MLLRRFKVRIAKQNRKKKRVALTYACSFHKFHPSLESSQLCFPHSLCKPTPGKHWPGCQIRAGHRNPEIKMAATEPEIGTLRLLRSVVVSSWLFVIFMHSFVPSLIYDLVLYNSSVLCSINKRCERSPFVESDCASSGEWLVEIQHLNNRTFLRN